MTTDADALIAERFAAITDSTDDSDWGDVLRRRTNQVLAEAGGSAARKPWWIARPRPRPRRLAVILAAAALLGVLIATPAFGLQSAILDLFDRSDVDFNDAPAAPSVIKRDFADMSSGAPKGMNPNVIAGQTKLAGTFDFGGSKRRVWVAPTMTGSFCYVFQGISGGCRSPQVPSAGFEFVGGFVLRHGASEPAIDRLAGMVFEPSATTLRVTYEDGKTMSLPFVYVSEPINAGFFAYKPTRAQERAGHRPMSIALLDARGTTLAREHIDWEHETRDALQKAERFKQAMEEAREARSGNR